MGHSLPTLTLFCGLPGSGKTTLARRLEAAGHGVRLATDEWQDCIGISYSDAGFHERLQATLYRHALILLRRGVDVILEDGLWMEGERTQKFADARSCGALIDLHLFEVDFDTLWERLRGRNKQSASGAAPINREQLTLAHAISRTQLVLERTLAVVLRLAWLALISAVLVLALNRSSQLDLQPGNVFAVAAAFLGLGLLSGTLGIAVGALTGRRIYSTAAAAGIAVLGYVVNAIGNQTKNLDQLRDFSPYGWAYHHTPLANGIDWGGLVLLYGFSIVFIAIAVIAFRRRDITG